MFVSMKNINLTIHALLVYVISSGLGVFNIDIPMAFLIKHGA
jgi:hypothetical protein